MLRCASGGSGALRPLTTPAAWCVMHMHRVVLVRRSCLDSTQDASLRLL